MYARSPLVTTLASYDNVTNTQIKTLLTQGPLGAVIYANNLFQGYKSGVFSGCPASYQVSYNLINHAVIIVGYTSNGDYIIKNSWGTGWGDGGFAIIDHTRDCALTAQVHQYTSVAPSGTGLIYTNQVDVGTVTFSSNY